MDKNTYRKHFSRRVRWSLSKSEAAETLADYEDLLSSYPEGDCPALVRNLGTPAQAAGLLIDQKAYHRWLAVFAALLACLVLPLCWLWSARFDQSPLAVLLVLLAAAVVGSLVWFCPWKEAAKKPLPKGLVLTLATLVLGGLAAAGGMVSLSAEIWRSLPPGQYGAAARAVLWTAGTASALLALMGLVKARLSDRRWCGAYLLGLTVLLECVMELSILCSMSLEPSIPGWWVGSALAMGLMGAAGVAAAGRALC